MRLPGRRQWARTATRDQVGRQASGQRAGGWEEAGEGSFSGARKQSRRGWRGEGGKAASRGRETPKGEGGSPPSHGARGMGAG